MTQKSFKYCGNSRPKVGMETVQLSDTLELLNADSLTEGPAHIRSLIEPTGFWYKKQSIARDGQKIRQWA